MQDEFEMNKFERVVEAMKEFDEGIPEELKERIVQNDPDYQNYQAVMKKLDELYFALAGERNEDPKEIMLEALKTIDFFEYKYDIDMTYIQKMLIS